jgi:regulator of RNase E activity RraA
MPISSFISDETLKNLNDLSTQTLVDALWRNGWPQGYIEGSHPLQLGQKMSGRAVTLRMVPERPDLAEDKPKGDQSAEYVAMELCGPNEVLVIDAMGWKYASVGGDIKFFRLFQNKSGGLVTDGSVRDSSTIKKYGFPVYSAGTTSKQGAAEFFPWQVNTEIQCGGTLVRPGDAVVGDDDGVIIVPSSIARKIVETANEREEVERIVKAQLVKENCSPGKYYPFNDNTWDLFEEKTGESRPGKYDARPKKI